MPKRVEYSASARQDLLNIAGFIAADNPIRAHSFVDDLKEACESLGDHPERFALVPEFKKLGMRRRVFGNYLIFYKISDQSITIMRVLNHAEDYEKVLFGD